MKIILSRAAGERRRYPADRITVLTLRFCFLDEVDVPAALRLAVDEHLIDGEVDIADASYFLSQIKRLYLRDGSKRRQSRRVLRAAGHQTVAMGGRIQP